MEFHEKLQELRKARGLTQEELADEIYVSRTAVSKWESGRGYPSIDSLKEISHYFSVSIDDLLSTDKLLTIAEKENKSNLKTMCETLFGLVDICSFLLIILPLYPNKVSGFVESVNLFAYTQTTPLNRLFYWGMFLTLITAGILKLLFIKLKMEKCNNIVTWISMILSIISVIFLAMTREAYAVVIIFVLLLMKGLLLLKSTKI